jgi:hypothetical protein
VTAQEYQAEADRLTGLALEHWDAGRRRLAELTMAQAQVRATQAQAQATLDVDWTLENRVAVHRG